MYLWEDYACDLVEAQRKFSPGTPMNTVLGVVRYLGDRLLGDEPRPKDAQERRLDDFHRGDCACVDGDCLVLVNKVTRRGMWVYDEHGGRCWVSRKHIGDVELVRPKPTRK